MEANSSSLNASYQVEDFQTAWQHCSQSSNFLANTTLSDSRARNLLSSALNELFELVFRLGSGEQEARFKVARKGGRAYIELKLPLSTQALALVSAELQRLQDGSAQRLYLEQLGGEELSPLFGVLHLMSDFGARVHVRLLDNELSLDVQLPLDDGP
jgi:hypothetical protein